MFVRLVQLQDISAALLTMASGHGKKDASCPPSSPLQGEHLAIEPALQDASAALIIMVSVERGSGREILRMPPTLEKVGMQTFFKKNQPSC